MAFVHHILTSFVHFLPLEGSSCIELSGICQIIAIFVMEIWDRSLLHVMSACVHTAILND